MQEIPHSKHKVTQTTSWQNTVYVYSIGISNYKNRRIKTFFIQQVCGGLNYHLGTVSGKMTGGLNMV